MQKYDKNSNRENIHRISGYNLVKLNTQPLRPLFFPANAPFPQPYIPKRSSPVYIFAKKKSDKTKE